MNLRKINRLSTLMVMVALTVFSLSCGDDDEVNGNQLYGQIGVATGDLLSGDCEVRIAAYEELIVLYGKGRNCAEIKQYVEDEGYADVQEFLDELAATRDDEIANC